MKQITVKSKVNAPVGKVWNLWSTPEHIVKWNTPAEDWHTTRAENDLRSGGKFLSRMEAKDGSFGFDFAGTYNEVIPNKHIAYTITDGRKVTVDFQEENNETLIETVFEAENQNSLEQQRDGWQAIMDNFKKYAEKYSV
ncbi:SRPBCC family protein [Galbibacter sp. PAP.153]|uniref:SRPBCC family protein n=1 Tax=Galbibacter sp. PAP.153 TaxID=3104623 RepID=UPI00300903C6